MDSIPHDSPKEGLVIDDAYNLPGSNALLMMDSAARPPSKLASVSPKTQLLSSTKAEDVLRPPMAPLPFYDVAQNLSDAIPSDPQTSTSTRKGSRARGSSTKESRIRFNSTHCSYPVVRNSAQAVGWKLVNENSDEDKKKKRGRKKRWDLIWTDHSNMHTMFMRMKPYQTINHFPGMACLGRKARMAQNLNKMRRKFGREFNFIPKTWILPTDLASFKKNFDEYGNSTSTFIIKPDAGCQGRGIFLTRDISKIDARSTTVAQKYLKNPLLISGYKFDLRVYAVVTSCEPLRIYLMDDGLIRMATSKYSPPSSANEGDRCMHLTNYAVNKNSENFVQSSGGSDDGAGSKRSIRWFFRWLDEHFGEEARRAMWSDVGSIIVKTLISVQPILAKEYKRNFQHENRPPVKKVHDLSSRAAGVDPKAKSTDECTKEDTTEVELRENLSEQIPEESKISGKLSFEEARRKWRSSCFCILGVDIIIDSNLKPWLVEVNQLPSYGTDSQLDEDIKGRLLRETFSLVDMSVDDYKNYSEFSAAGSRIRTEQESTGQVMDGTTSSKDWVKCLEDFYAKYRPEKVSSAQRLMQKHEGKEQELLQHLRSKYSQTIELYKKVERFYLEHNPEKVGDVPSILEKYKDRDDELIANLELKYNTKFESDANVSQLADIQKQVESSNREYFSIVESGKLSNLRRVYPPIENAKLLRKYNKLLAAAKAQMEKSQHRLTAPLQRSGDVERRGSSTNLSSTVAPQRVLVKQASSLPPIRPANEDGRVTPRMPSAEQIKAATWLMKGYSSKTAKERLSNNVEDDGASGERPTERKVDPLARRNVEYGLAYREKMKQKKLPTIAISRVTLGADF